TSDRIIDKPYHANKWKSSGQWVIHFLAQKVMSGKRWDLGVGREASFQFSFHAVACSGRLNELIYAPFLVRVRAHLHSVNWILPYQ
ncbi:hypothetical protein, partial [Xenorhabdus bovienii]|uniref:hypothetical protein n=1 Tax=Xenorhabdus bovienii TaxID=40576 RepID=UPI001E59F819